MQVAVLVPLRITDPHRAAAWAHVEAHYQQHHPDWDVIAAKIPGRWSKGRAVQRARSATTAPILVIADSDSWTGPADLTAAVDLARTHGWVTPHRKVRRLTEASTSEVLAGATPIGRPLARTPYLGVRGGGITVVTAAAYDTIGGIDPRFAEWGGEDFAFGHALHALCGPGLRRHGTLWHLWHPPAETRYPGDAKALLARYRAARRDAELMRALVEEHRGAPREVPDRDRHLAPAR
jgi:hypothetical protein